MRTKLQSTRKAQGFTQTQFAEYIGTSQSHYGQIETGVKNPSLDLAFKIKRALHYSGDDIFDNR